MKQLLISLVVLAAFAKAAVIEATDDTFDSVTKSEFVLMEFYAPWCGHCKKLDPEYTSAAEQLGDAAVLAKIDATKEQTSATKYNIQGFPTIKIFRDGVLSGDYEGGRTASDIVKYVKGNVGPAVKPIVTADELNQFKKDNAVAAVAFLDAPAGDDFDAFEGAAKALRSLFAFAVVTDSSLFDGNAGDIVLYKNFDTPRQTYAGERTAEALQQFFKSEGVPSFDEIGPTNYKSYLERKLPILWVFATPKDVEAMDAGRGAAPEFKGKVSFVWIDSSKYAGMAQRLGLSGDKFPAVAIDHEGTHFALPVTTEITAENLKDFVNKYLEGTLTPTIRSEAAPEPHTVEGLTTLVGSTFDSLVNNADVDVFVEFYAPWCGHCKQLAPVYEAVAKALEDKPVRIAKFDATANDFDQKKFNVKGFPTMFYVPKSSHEPEVYEGDRSEEALTKFINDRLA